MGTYRPKILETLLFFTHCNVVMCAHTYNLQARNLLKHMTRIYVYTVLAFEKTKTTIRNASYSLQL